jgi:hypothetical protein
VKTDPIITAYVTRYALTKGIIRVEGHQCGPTMISYYVEGYPNYAHGNDWHTTPEKAARRAEAMRVKKITSLKATIAKLEKLSFEVQS